LDDAWRTAFPSAMSQSLLTWEWQWHEKLYSTSGNKAGKALLDLSRVPTKVMQYTNANVHRPNVAVCSEDLMWTRNVESPTVLHHYIGTLEQFTFRSDPRQGRRTVETYMHYQDVNASTVRPWESRRWLVDFVEALGAAEAAHLLKGAGRVERDAPPALAEDEFFQKLQEMLPTPAKTRISWIGEERALESNK
jgi:hypothetical protein